LQIKAGEIIKAKREEKKISLVDFAREVGISPGYLSQLENGKKVNPNLEVMLKITEGLDIDLDMLLGSRRCCAWLSPGIGTRRPLKIMRCRKK